MEAGNTIAVAAGDVKVTVRSGLDAERLCQRPVLGEHAEERAVRSIVFHHMIAEPPDNVQVAVRSPGHPGGAVQTATSIGDENVCESAIGGIEAHNRIVELAADVQKPVRPKFQPHGVIEPGVGWDERAQECAVRPVVTQHLVSARACDVKIPIRPEGQAVRQAQPATASGDEHTDEGAVRLAVAEHAVAAGAGQEQFRLGRQRRQQEDQAHSQGEAGRVHAP